MSRRNWIALYSQTGGELIRLSKALGRYPDVVLTDSKRPVPEELSANCTVLQMSAKAINAWLMKERKINGEPRKNVEPGSLITAHGYLRIIPAKVLEYLNRECEALIYNGHPGLITMYPELKGKDPQVRVAEGINSGKYSIVGSVVHVMVPEVDSGLVIQQVQQAIPKRPMTLQEVIDLQARLSFECWYAVLKELLK